MNYWAKMYGPQSDDFIEGAIAAVEAYGVHRDGTREIGSPEKPVSQVIEEIKEGCGVPDQVKIKYMPEDAYGDAPDESGAVKLPDEDTEFNLNVRFGCPSCGKTGQLDYACVEECGKVVDCRNRIQELENVLRNFSSVAHLDNPHHYVPKAAFIKAKEVIDGI